MNTGKMQKGVIQQQGFHGGIANHDTLVGQNQVAYAENVFLRNPDFVSLNQKPENYALTDNDLALCMNESRRYGHDYFGTELGKMYDAGSNVVRCDIAGNKYILNIFTVGQYLHFCWEASRIGRIAIDDLVDGPTRGGGQLQSEGTYNETWLTGSSEWVNKLISLAGGDFYAIGWNGGGLKYISSTFVVSARGSIRQFGVGLWRTQNYIKAFGSKGNLYWNDGANSVYSAEVDLDSTYIEGIKIKDMELLISGISSQNSHLFVPNGEGKTLIASARLSGPDAKKVHYYGRNAFVGMNNLTERQNGQDTHGSFNDIGYVINNDGVMSYGKTVAGLPDCWNKERVTNYNNDTVSDVGFIKVLESVSGTTYLYWSWRAGSVCGVDRINLDKMNNPDTFVSKGEFHSQVWNFGHSKAYIKKMKIRAYTTAGQTIKVYSSVDGEAFVLKATLNGTDPKKYFVVDAIEEGYTLQWKFVLETDDEDETPKLFAYSFTYELPDND